MIVTVKILLKYIGCVTMMIGSLAFLFWYIPAPHAEGTLLTMELIFFGPIVLLALLAFSVGLLYTVGDYIIDDTLRFNEWVKKLLEKILWGD